MRDIKRIEPLLNQLQSKWEAMPDMRFFQMIEVVKSKLGKDDCFNVEDRKALEAIESICTGNYINKSKDEVRVSNVCNCRDCGGE